jgi:hypothetical protein
MPFKKKTPAPAAVEVKQSVLTPEETAIAQIVGSTDDSWSTIGENTALDYSLGKDAFELPKPAKKLELDKKFKFCWITRNPDRLRQITSKEVPLKWWPVNSTQPVAGAFDRFVNVAGCVPREDQMLMFKPWWMFERERAMKQRLAQNVDFAGDVTRKDGTQKDGMEFRAGKRSSEGKQMGIEITGTDQVIYDDSQAEDMSDLTTE